jgi:hypothetical protein
MNARPEDAEIQGYFCPLQPPKLLEMRLRKGTCVLTELGLEKRCSRCDVFWPMDTEFWFPSKTRDGLFAWCRACYITFRWPTRGAPALDAPPPLLAEHVQTWSASP